MTMDLLNDNGVSWLINYFNKESVHSELMPSQTKQLLLHRTKQMKFTEISKLLRKLSFWQIQWNFLGWNMSSSISENFFSSVVKHWPYPWKCCQLYPLGVWLTLGTQQHPVDKTGNTSREWCRCLELEEIPHDGGRNLFKKVSFIGFAKQNQL